MASQEQKLTEYEHKRLDNIRRNHEMIAALKIHSKATELSKRPRVGTKSYSVKSEKKPKIETPVVVRRSLRTRGIPRDSKALHSEDTVDPTPTETLPSAVELESPVDMAKEGQIPGHSPSSMELTEYERKRLDNIRRNNEMIAALKIHSKAAQLSKHQRVGTKSNVKSEKKPKMENPVVIIRQSLRARGVPPETLTKTQPSLLSLCPLPMSDTYVGTRSDSSFVKSLVRMANEEAPCSSSSSSSSKGGKLLNVNLGSLTLDRENIARIAPGRITDVRFFPSCNVKMIVAGNWFGNIGFWNVGESGGVYLYRPHQAPITGILVQPHCLSKIYTSCYDGFLRLMDAEKEIFDLVFNTDEGIYTLSQPQNEANCVYFSGCWGVLTAWDNRIGKCSSLVLHEGRINTIDFNNERPHILATSCSDGTACTWDLRYFDGSKLTALKTFTHKRAVQSAYFSPSGCSLATTSMDNTIGIYSGVNLEDAATVYHYNQTDRSYPFRAKWGWDDSYLFVGSMKRGVNVVSAVQRETVMTLQSPRNSGIPCRFEAHYCEVGMLAGATSVGQVHIWTSR